MDTPFVNGNGSSMAGRWCECVAWAGLLGTIAATSRLPDLPLCPVHYFTGVECPTCGVTRSVWYVLHADVLHALQMNPLGLVVVAVLLRRLVSLLFPKSLAVRWANAEIVNIGLLTSFFTIGTYRCLPPPIVNVAGVILLLIVWIFGRMRIKDFSLDGKPT